MERIRPILSLVLRILFILVTIVTTFVTLLTAYMVFAPDTFPKPFHLVYSYPEKGIPFEVPPGTVVVIYQNITGDNPGTNNPSSSGNGLTPSPKAEYKPGEGIIYDTGAKIINLADPGGKRLIRITTQLEYAPNDSVAYEAYLKAQSGSSTNKATTDYVASFTDELAKKKPLIDDVLNSVIASHTFNELYTASGKESLKTEIVTKLNEKILDYKVIAVYFSEFVIE